jgi:hypothetical protein
VPRDKAIVFIHFGHSNMAGVGRKPPELLPFFFTTAPHLWSYQGGGKFVPAVEPTAPDPELDRDGAGGPGMAWLRTVAAGAAPEYHFISIAKARTGASSVEYLKGGLYYSTFMDRAIELKGRVTFGAVFIMLGITELTPMSSSEEIGFADRMARIIADIRRDLDEPDLPVLHTDYELEAGGPWAISQPIGMRLRAQLRWLPDRITNLVLVPTDGTPMCDNHHFDLTGHKMWVERGVQLMRDRGWFRWAPRSSPSARSAVSAPAPPAPAVRSATRGRPAGGRRERRWRWRWAGRPSRGWRLRGRAAAW